MLLGWNVLFMIVFLCLVPRRIGGLVKFHAGAVAVWRYAACRPVLIVHGQWRIPAPPVARAVFDVTLMAS